MQSTVGYAVSLLFLIFLAIGVGWEVLLGFLTWSAESLGGGGLASRLWLSKWVPFCGCWLFVGWFFLLRTLVTAATSLLFLFFCSLHAMCVGVRYHRHGFAH